MRRDPLSCHHLRGLVLVENIRGTGASDNLSHEIPKFGRLELHANHLRCQVWPVTEHRCSHNHP
jgi:hypothetical protein